MENPQSMSPGSIMPNYPWLLKKDIDIESTPAKIRAMQTLGVPYEEGYDAKAIDELKAQAIEIETKLKEEGIKHADANKEIIALIAYLQRLGTDVEK